MIRETPIREIMTRDVVCMLADEPFSHVAEKMKHHHIRHLPVVDKDKKLVGMITQRDLYHAVAPRKTENGDYYDPRELDQYILQHIMTPNPVTLKPDDFVVKAIKIFAEHKYGALSVVDDEHKLTGIVSQIDILKFIAENIM